MLVGKLLGLLVLFFISVPCPDGFEPEMLIFFLRISADI
jgi:hypothetical protein